MLPLARELGARSRKRRGATPPRSASLRPSLCGIPALTGRGVRRIMPTLRDVWTEYRRRVPTRVLNQWLDEVTTKVPPPTSSGTGGACSWSVR